MKKISFLIIMIIFLSGCYEDVPTGIDLSSIQKDNTRPGCSISAPANYSSHVVGSSISIQVNASDEENNLSNVKIYLDNNLQTTISLQPFTYSLNTTNLSTGTHIIKAIATDSQNASSPESYVNITITASNGNNPPECIITSPANNSSAAVGTIMTIVANATDSDGTIQDVRFYIDGILKSTDTAVPYSYAWNTTGSTVGNHTIKVVAKDNLNFETEKSVTISLTSGGTNIQVTGVSLNYTTANLTVNQTKLLTATVIPSDASNQMVFWSSSNSNVATVADGLVTAKAAGSATITVRTDDGNKTDTCNVTVSMPVTPDGFVLVEGGTYQMGLPESYSGEHNADEHPQHTVILSPYFIKKYEVTQEEWTNTMPNNPSDHVHPNNPVEMVSWYEILIYSNKRSLSEGLTPCYTIKGTTNPSSWGAAPTDEFDTDWNAVICNWNANGYRLPSEAEWEYAAKGGINSNGYIYSGSNNIGDVAWYGLNSGNYPRQVGGKTPNELGIYDMSGNVWEKCWDLHGEYSSTTQTNPHGWGTMSTHVDRGGSYLTAGSIDCGCTVTRRWNSNPHKKKEWVGFRLCRSL